MDIKLALQLQARLVGLGYDLGRSGAAGNGVDGVLGDVTIRAALDALSGLAGAATTPSGLTPVAPTGRTLAWGAKVDADFRDGVDWIVGQMGWPASAASWLMACMAWESGETFSPAVKNMAGSGATGLIQFMPSTAVHLGTTVEELASMTAVRQLGYVYLYFKGFSKIHGPDINLADMYMTILMPKYIGQPDDAVLFSDGIAYRQNSGLDVNRDGKVTKMEAAGKVYAKLDKGNQPGLVFVY